MRFTYNAEQWVPVPIERVFLFFANPDNLPRLLPAWQKARIDAATLVPPPPAPDASTSPQTLAGEASRITLSFRPLPLLPLRLQWEAQIDAFHWNDSFCDLQLRGPFAFWRHCHRVSPETLGSTPGTSIRDAIEYEPPFGLLGSLANTLAIERQLRSTFAFRHRRTAELLRP